MALAALLLSGCFVPRSSSPPCSHGSSGPSARASSVTLQLFPSAPPPDSPELNDRRNAKMATLLGALIDDPESAKELLRESDSLLLAPFRAGSAPAGSVYGTGSAQEKLAKYEEAMNERIERASSSGPLGQRQAAALRRMRDYVVAELAEESAEEDDGYDGDDLDPLIRFRGGNTLRLRGGGRFGRAPWRSTVHEGVDAILDGTEAASKTLSKGLRDLEPTLRRTLRSLDPRPMPTMGDAAVAGAAAGFLCGAVLVGDPRVMAVAGAAGFAYTHRYPEKVPSRVCAVVDRCSDEVAKLRRGIVERWG